MGATNLISMASEVNEYVRASLPDWRAGLETRGGTPTVGVVDGDDDEESSVQVLDHLEAFTDVALEPPREVLSRRSSTFQAHEPFVSKGPSREPEHRWADWLLRARRRPATVTTSLFHTSEGDGHDGGGDGDSLCTQSQSSPTGSSLARAEDDTGMLDRARSFADARRSSSRLSWPMRRTSTADASVEVSRGSPPRWLHPQPTPSPLLVWAETKVLPLKAVGIELQAQRDCLAMTLDQHGGDLAANDAADADAGALGVTVPLPVSVQPTTCKQRNTAGNKGTSSAASTSLRSLFVLNIKHKTPRGIVRALVSAASRAGLIPPGAEAQQQAVDSLLREDVGPLISPVAKHTAVHPSLDASFSSCVTDEASCAAYGDLGMSSPWEKVFHARGFIVAVGRVSGMSHRTVLVGRLARAGTASLLGAGAGGSRVHFVAVVLASPEAAHAPMKSAVATAHTIATLLRDDRFFAEAMAARTPSDVRAHVEGFLHRKLASVNLPPPFAPPAFVDKDGCGTIAGTSCGGGSRNWCCSGCASVCCDFAAESAAHASGWFPFSGVCNDVKRRLPHYVSDWTDGIKDTSAVTTSMCAVIWMYFSTLAPALALGIVLQEEMDSQMGIPEVILAEALSNLAFSLFAGSPILVLRVTGTTVVYIKLLFTWCKSLGVQFLPFYAAAGLWCALFVVLAAAFDAATLIHAAGRFTEELLAALVSVIFIHSAMKEVGKAATKSKETPEMFLKHLVLFLGTFAAARQVNAFRKSPYLSRRTRAFIANMSSGISLVLLTYVSYLVSPAVRVERADVDISHNRFPTSHLGGRPWLVNCWTLTANHTLLAALPGLIFAVQVFVESNLASLLTAGPDHRLVKGTGHHLNFLCVGVATAACSLFGRDPQPESPVKLCPVSPEHGPSI